jgi:hypothetical protein
MNKLMLDTAIVLAVTLLIVALLEFSLRLCGVVPIAPPHFTMAFSTEDKSIGYKAIPYSEWSFLIAPDGKGVKRITGTVDKEGYRPVVNRCQDCQKILVLGDSMAFAAEAPDDQTWPELLSQELQRNGLKYYTRNISFRGWNTLQVDIAAKEALKVSNAAALLYFFSPNDPAETFTAMYGPTPLLKAREEGAYEIVPADFGIYHDKMLENKHLGQMTYIKYHSSIFALVKHLSGFADEPEPVKDWRREGYYNSWNNGATWGNLMRYLGLLVGEDSESRSVRGGIQFLLDDLAGACSKAHVKFYVAFLPFGVFTQGETLQDFKNLTGYSESELQRGAAQWRQFGQKVREMTEQAGGTYLNLSPDVFAGMNYRQYAAAPDDWHYSIEAHKKVAVEVASHLGRALGR